LKYFIISELNVQLLSSV